MIALVDCTGLLARPAHNSYCMQTVTLTTMATARRDWFVGSTTAINSTRPTFIRAFQPLATVANVSLTANTRRSHHRELIPCLSRLLTPLSPCAESRLLTSPSPCADYDSGSMYVAIHIIITEFTYHDPKMTTMTSASRTTPWRSENGGIEPPSGHEIRARSRACFSR